MVETQTKKFTIREQGDFLINIAHDEFLESVIAGQPEDYSDWADFMHYCLDQIVKYEAVVPEQRWPLNEQL